MEKENKIDIKINIYSIECNLLIKFLKIVNNVIKIIRLFR